MGGERGGRGKWLALAAALLGWLFDGAEMGVFSMVGRQAVIHLLRTNDEGVIGLWFGVVTAGFLVGAATGGVLFGWLGDRIGREGGMHLHDVGCAQKSHDRRDVTQQIEVEFGVKRGVECMCWVYHE